jgi:hypothetical protein
MTLRCVGKHVTVTVNGLIAVDADFPSMPDEGIIAWQLHGGVPGVEAPEEVAFKDIRFTDLTKRPIDGFVPLFNGKDMTGWKTHPDRPGDWRIEGGLLVGRGHKKNCLYSERGDYEDFHFRIEAKINEKGNSGQQFRKAFSPELFGGGYEAQIDSGNHPAKTGSLFVEGGSPAVRINDVLAPANTWFIQEVTARGNHITISVNGSKVVDFVDKDWKWRKGHLALQLWEPETVVHFRKIEIKELTTPAGGRKAKYDHNGAGSEPPVINYGKPPRAILPPGEQSLQKFWDDHHRNVVASPPFPKYWAPYPNPFPAPTPAGPK